MAGFLYILQSGTLRELIIAPAHDMRAFAELPALSRKQ